MQGTLQLGKLPGRTLAATDVAGPNPSRLFYVRDTHTCTQFLVDTGSEVSIIPPSPSDRRHQPDKLTLMAVNNTHRYVWQTITHPQPWSLSILSLDIYHRRCAETHSQG